MTRMHSILFECSCYRGKASRERCKAVEEHVMGRVEGACGLESAAMRELDMGGGIVQPTVELVYSTGSYRRLIPIVDEALREIGVVAVKALVSHVVSHTVEGAIAGAGAGLLAGGATTRGTRGGRTAAVLASTAIGAALGAIGGKLAKERSLAYIATRHAGGWTIKRFPSG